MRLNSNIKSLKIYLLYPIIITHVNIEKMYKKYKFFLVSSIICMLFSTDRNLQAQGSFTEKTFYSKALDSTMSYLIYLPKGYDSANKTEKYPVVYFYHGSTVKPQAYSNLSILFNLLISSGQISKCIVVMPDGSAPPYFGSFYTNSPFYGNYEDYIISDLIKHIDDSYNVYAQRDKRAVMGHSMGAYGAVKHAVLHPELFAICAAHSGPLNITLWDDILPVLLSENNISKPYHFAPNEELVFTTETYSMAAAFSPNMDNPPYYVDFPVDENGLMVQTVLDKWNLHNPANIITKINSKTPPFFYLDCGDNDDFKLMAQNKSFADTLTKYGIKHKYETFLGGHSDLIALRVAVSVQVIDSIFRNTETSIVQQFANNAMVKEYYPVPVVDKLVLCANSSTKNENIEVCVFNPTGSILYRQTIKSFDTKYEIPTDKLPSGIYFLTLQNKLNYQLIKFVK